jgi:hypothetical protein
MAITDCRQHLASHQAQTEVHRQKAGVDGVPQKPVRPGFDQSMVHLDGDFPAPVSAEVMPRPNCQKQSQRFRGQAGRHDERRYRQEPAQPAEGDDFQHQGRVSQEHVKRARRFGFRTFRCCRVLSSDVPVHTERSKKSYRGKQEYRLAQQSPVKREEGNVGGKVKVEVCVARENRANHTGRQKDFPASHYRLFWCAAGAGVNSCPLFQLFQLERDVDRGLYLHRLSVQ